MFNFGKYVDRTEEKIDKGMIVYCHFFLFKFPGMLIANALAFFSHQRYFRVA